MQIKMDFQNLDFECLTWLKQHLHCFNQTNKDNLHVISKTVFLQGIHYNQYKFVFVAWVFEQRFHAKGI